MGSIRRAPRSSGRWEARYRDPLGRQRTRTFASKADAKAFLASEEARIARGTWRDVGRGRMRFDEVAAEWLASNPGKRATTYARDATVINVHLDPVIGSLPIARIGPAQIQQVIDRMIERGLGARTIWTDYGVLRAIFSWAVETDIVDRSPCRGVRLPKTHRASRPLVSAAEIERLAAALPADYRVAVYLGALGLRQGEVFGLRVGAIDFSRLPSPCRPRSMRSTGGSWTAAARPCRPGGPSPSRAGSSTASPRT